MASDLPLAYPLQWPLGRPRTKEPRRSLFKTSWSRALKGLSAELRRLGAEHVVISTDHALTQSGMPMAGRRPPDDHGVAVYFKRRGADRVVRPYVLSCDAWRGTENNMHALALHIESLRGQERWGVATIEEAFAGHLALPAPAIPGSWREVLGLRREDSAGPGPGGKEAVDNAFKRLSKLAHPDAGGDPEHFRRIVEARDAAYLEHGWT